VFRIILECRALKREKRFKDVREAIGRGLALLNDSDRMLAFELLRMKAEVS
jgi:hypothetical protein